MVLREIHSNTGLPQETRKNNLTLHLKELEKREQQSLKLVEGKKEMIKIRVEVNEIETKKTTEKINETKSCFFEMINKINNPLARLTKKKRGLK